jgi:hypothetical protein
MPLTCVRPMRTTIYHQAGKELQAMNHRPLQSRSAARGATACFLAAALVVVPVLPAALQAQTAPLQLDSSCTVLVGNQTAMVRPDGKFLVNNIPIFQSRGTGVVNELFRVRATCLRNGQMVTGQSDFFSLTPGQTTFIATVLPGAIAPIPTSVALTATNGSLTAGATAQLTATATLSDGSTLDVTPRAAGTVYLSTNPDLATVSDDGLVTAAANPVGQAPVFNALVAALHEGNTATFNFQIFPPASLTACVTGTLISTTCFAGPVTAPVALVARAADGSETPAGQLTPDGSGRFCAVLRRDLVYLVRGNATCQGKNYLCSSTSPALFGVSDPGASGVCGDSSAHCQELGTVGLTCNLMVGS